MTRGKDEEKMMGPMFPRLHVNDTERGGPRAPPRNKMALYEQLSIPSQRFSHSVPPLNPNNTSANLVPNSGQGGGSERGMFFSLHLPSAHQSEKHYSQYSDRSPPLTQVEQRKKADEDDFTVPIFVHSFPGQEHHNGRSSTNAMEREKPLSSNPSYFSHSLEFQKAKELSTLEQSMRQATKIQKEDNPKVFLAGRVKKAISNFPLNERAEALKKQDVMANSIDRLRTDGNLGLELCAESHSPGDRQSTDVLLENKTAVDKRNSSTSVRTSLSGVDRNIVHDLSNDSESRENESCMQMGTLERGDSVSETSILDSIPANDITPDDIVGIIGQKHFWKARRAIVNQQRVFAVQVFELHRLIKVQQLMAASPHLLLEETTYLGGKTVKPLSGNKHPLDYAVKAIPNISKQKCDSEKPIHKKEGSAESTINKAPPFPSSQHEALPSNYKPSPINNDSNYPRGGWGFNSPYGHQWLIPVMTPSEGLVYKPYPGPGFVDPAYGGPGPNPPTIVNFLPPGYGVPASHPQYQMPSFPPGGPHGYFPPYGMQVMNTAAFSASSVEQSLAMPGQLSAGEANYSVHRRNPFAAPTNKKNGTVPDALNLDVSNDVEVQASTASSPSERTRGSRAVEGRNVLPLFPTSPVLSTTRNPSPQPPPSEPERASRVIKVVPHNPRTASETAARIFQSIQEERKQYDSL